MPKTERGEGCIEIKGKDSLPYPLTLRNRLEAVCTLGGGCGVGSTLLSGSFNVDIMFPLGVAVGSLVSALVLYKEIRYVKSVKNGTFKT